MADLVAGGSLGGDPGGLTSLESEGISLEIEEEVGDPEEEARGPGDEDEDEEDEGEGLLWDPARAARRMRQGAIWGWDLPVIPGKEPDREAWEELLAIVRGPRAEWAARAKRSLVCGTDLAARWVKRCAICGEPLLVAQRCGGKWCQGCGSRLRGRVRRGLMLWRQDVKGNVGRARHGQSQRIRRMTLTIGSRPKGQLAVMIEELLRVWRRFSQTKAFRVHVRGAFIAIHIVYGEEHGWHPHLHVDYEGAYWPREPLVATWIKCSHGLAGGGGQWIDDVTSEKNPKYLAKEKDPLYLAKSSWPEGVNAPELLAELLAATWKTKMFRVIGQARGYIDPPEVEPACCGCCGGDLVRVAWCPNSIAAIEYLARDRKERQEKLARLSGAQPEGGAALAS